MSGGVTRAPPPTERPVTEADFSKLAYRNDIQIMVKAVGVHRLTVMKPTDAAPNPVYSPHQTLAVSALFLAAVVTVLVAIEHPLLVAGVVATVGVTAIVVTLALDYRRRAGRVRRVCVPRTGICVEA